MAEFEEWGNILHPGTFSTIVQNALTFQRQICFQKIWIPILAHFWGYKMSY
jgi:hypothetical protein